MLGLSLGPSHRNCFALSKVNYISTLRSYTSIVDEIGARRVTVRECMETAGNMFNARRSLHIHILYIDICRHAYSHECRQSALRPTVIISMLWQTATRWGKRQRQNAREMENQNRMAHFVLCSMMLWLVVSPRYNVGSSTVLTR